MVLLSYTPAFGRGAEPILCDHEAEVLRSSRGGCGCFELVMLKRRHRILCLGRLVTLTPLATRVGGLKTLSTTMNAIVSWRHLSRTKRDVVLEWHLALPTG